MITITLPPSLEKALIEQAKKAGTSPELLAVETLSKCFPDRENESPPKPGETMLDFFGDFVGCFDSANLDTRKNSVTNDTGDSFTEILLRKYREGKI